MGFSSQGEERRGRKIVTWFRVYGEVEGGVLLLLHVYSPLDMLVSFMAMV